MLFAHKLTEDLLSISHDKHIRVRFDPEGITRQNQAVSDEDKQKLLQQDIERYKKNNFGFKEIKILDGNIGYLNLTGFADASFAGETAVAAMNYLSNADAIIFDLRENGGGSPSMIQLITSYLYDSEPVHLNNFYWRPKDLNTQTWTLPHVPGKRSPDTPVYVLTSHSTFSAAEEFSYNLKNLKRATLIGETTGGGAHPGGPVIATDRFIVGVPSGRAINPITNTNWEGVGVVPHVQVQAKEALATAHIKALEALKEKSKDDGSKYRYNWVLETLKFEDNDTQIDKSTLELFVGNYGPRVITLEGNNLHYQRGEGTKYKLIPMSDNRFLIKELSYFRIQFESKDDKVTAIFGLYDNGNTDKNLKN
jgi:C-terminal processing protease CtpA/Prc